MKKIILPLLAMLLIGCGGGSENSVEETLNNSQNAPESNPLRQENPDSYTSINDPLFTREWHLSSDNGSSIYKAWNSNQGNKVRIAIIDTCFDIYHEDAPKNIYKTYNAKTKNSNVACEENESHHGIYVQGVLGSPKNSKGLVGVAPEAEYILIKLPFKNTTTEDIMNAFLYAKENNAKIISNSWGSSFETDSEADLYEYIAKQNIAIFFASGNDSENLDYKSDKDECMDPNTICIGASNEDNFIAEYSNYGSMVEFLAPAGDHGIITTLENNSYGYFAGTSAATPVAAGIASFAYSIDKNLSLSDLKSILRISTDKIGNYPYNEEGKSSVYGYGKLNAEKVIENTKNRG